MTVERLNIMGAHVHRVTLEEALNIFQEYLSEDICKLIVTPNSEIVMNASKDKELMEIINTADLVIPDGIGLMYASKVMRQPLKERVTGIDFLEGTLNLLNSMGKSIYLLGSKPGVAEKAAENMKKKYPNMQIAGTHHGYFKEADEKDIVDKINAATPDFLCVALGAPKQEKFINKYKYMLKTKSAIGVGGSLDVWSGELKRAPKFYRENGLEWFYRLIQQPSRYKRMAVLPLFMLRVILKGGK